jgi:hypothetical protein
MRDKPSSPSIGSMNAETAAVWPGAVSTTAALDAATIRQP